MIKMSDVQPEPPSVTVERHGNMILLRKQYDYWIELDRINTHEKLVWWIRHLSGKNWVDTRAIRDLIDIVHNHMPVTPIERS